MSEFDILRLREWEWNKVSLYFLFSLFLCDALLTKSVQDLHDYWLCS